MHRGRAEPVAPTVPQVLAVYVLAGPDDFLVHVAVQSNEQLHAFVVDSLAQRREVVSFRTQVIYQQTAARFVGPLSSPPESRPQPPRRVRDAPSSEL